MSNYISSNANRFYAALEATYGQAAAITAANRFPAARLGAHQALMPGKRQDKTGSRTFLGISPSSRRKTAFEVRSYLTSWTGTGEPSYGPLFHAGLGLSPLFSSGLTVGSALNSTTIRTTAPHGLTLGSAVSVSGEIRFVTSVLDAATFVINASFSNLLSVNTVLAPTVSYGLATALPSVTLYDYWSPSDSVSRLITGAAVDTLEVAINGDYHNFSFVGPACDLLDTSSFSPGAAGMASFPAEPALSSFDYSIVPGHLGQAWLGSTADQFFTLTAASVQIKNNLSLRNQEFGSAYPSTVAPGAREVITNFSLMAQDDAQSTALYSCAKRRSQIMAMFQLGQQQGQLMGIFMPNITPEIPTYNDSEPRLVWEFNNSLAQGVSDDEIYIAFA
jgi:hypothetical protein